MSTATNAHPQDRLVTTLRDVARAAGVSTASVSRALAGRGVSEGLRARIMAAAARLGYQPNLAARALACRRSGLVAVLVRTMAEPLIASVVEAFERGLQARGYGILLAARGDPAEHPPASARALLGRGVDALVFAGIEPLPAEIDLLAAHDLPWLQVTDGPGRGPHVIDIGRRRGAMLAGRYLLDLGHRRCGVIARQGSGTWEGLAAAVAEGGAALVLSDAPPGNDNAEAAKAAICELLDREAPPTAVVCGSDAEALAVARECLMRGITVPQDISIVGFGDDHFARHAVPSLTTIRVSPDAIGAQGAKMLAASLEARESTTTFEPTVKLVIRESTGPVA